MIRQVQQEHSKKAITSYIVSMSNAASDVLEVLFLMRLANLFDPSGSDSSLDIVPLFETIEDLRNCASIMNELLHNRAYMKQSFSTKQRTGNHDGVLRQYQGGRIPHV